MAASSEPSAAPPETTAETGGQAPLPAPDEQPTVALPVTRALPAQPAALPAWTVAASQPTAFAAQPVPARDLPAGVDPGDLATAPAASARRGRLRRRLRYLRHVRELLLRDLGGFTYEIHRTAGGNAAEPQNRLAAAKALRISTLDTEMLALESRLGEPHAEAVIREPGIGGTCPECGELHASDAHFCSRCGSPLDAKARAQRTVAAEPQPQPQPTTASHAVAEPQPASVLWAGGPRPAPAADDEPEVAEPPSAVTSQWLAGSQPTTFDRAAQPDEPAKRDELAAAEPAAPADAAKPDEPATTVEPATAAYAKPDEPAADEATPAEPAVAADEPVAAEPAPAKPKRAAKPRKPAKRAPAKPRRRPAAEKTPEPPAFEPNGRRDEDVPPPISPGDPLASPREQGS